MMTKFHRFVKVRGEYVRVDPSAPAILNMDQTHEPTNYPTVTINSKYANKNLILIYCYSMAKATGFDDLIIEENKLENKNTLLTIHRKKI